jgi:hypothetical protein
VGQGNSAKRSQLTICSKSEIRRISLFAGSFQHLPINSFLQVFFVAANAKQQQKNAKPLLFAPRNNAYSRRVSDFSLCLDSILIQKKYLRQGL